MECDHKEADSQLVAYAYHASAFSSGIMIRYPSADVDISILFVYHKLRCQIYLDNGTNKNRHIYDLNVFSMPEKHKDALPGNHGMGGNDYVGGFFRKRKKSCTWNKFKGEDANFKGNSKYSPDIKFDLPFELG